MEFTHTVEITDAVMAYATVVMAIFTVVIFAALLYCASLVKRTLEGIRIYLKFTSMQQTITNKNIINLFPGSEEEKQKAKKELDIINSNILNEIETF